MSLNLELGSKQIMHDQSARRAKGEGHFAGLGRAILFIFGGSATESWQKRQCRVYAAPSALTAVRTLRRSAVIFAFGSNRNFELQSSSFSNGETRPYTHSPNRVGSFGCFVEWINYARPSAVETAPVA